ncbi:MAG TPA: DUF1003 domain-containing protein [Vicinamibacterales bacterium]|nr:DUF1003 domain-containing protein [Vicinamibacterales bacterium]
MQREPSAGPPAASQAVEENIDAVKVWEQAALDQRSAAMRFSEWVTRALSGGPSLALHASWFGFWVLANSGVLPGVEPFDRFPFPLLTTMVSLEAIFLSLFVLASQSRLTTQADKRAQLDLQIDLLAEREMTAVVVMVADLARHMKAPVSLTAEQIRDLAQKTDVHSLVGEIERLPDLGAPKPQGEPAR